MGHDVKEDIPKQQRSEPVPSSPKSTMAHVRSWLVKFAFVFAIAHLAAASWSSSPATIHARANTTLPDLYEASVTELQAGLDAGAFTSVDLVKAYFKRIEEVNEQRAELRAVLETNPLALFEAQALDEERAFFGPRGPLHGIPVLLKDNIGTLSGEGMNTTAGSYSLLGSVVPRDAGVVTRLRKAGAIILGKANLSEFAHYRGNVASGWSGRGGQCTNAYFPAADPCGSSSGSGVAASIGLAAVTLGSETDGSITCPSSHNNVAGIKPTVGLTSRAGVIPISSHQDTVGPITRSIADAAAVLTVIAGFDPLDNYTSAAPKPIPDYTKALQKTALKGKRIGVPRKVFLDPAVTGLTQAELDAFEGALKTMASLGATIVDNANLPSAEDVANSNNETVVLNVDFKIEINAYYAALVSNPSGVRSLADLIAFDDDHKDLEEPAGYTDQSILLESQNTTGYDSAYYKALAFDHELGRTQGIDAALKTYKLDALVLPAGGLTTVPAAIAGYPIVTIPLGFFPNGTVVESAGPNTVWPAPGAPFGLSFFGTAFSEYDLVGFAYAYEQATQTRLQHRAYPAAIPLTQLSDVIGK